jgi:hypothetical protein
MKPKTILKITGLTILAIAAYSAIELYQDGSQKELNQSVEQEVARKNRLRKFFKEEKFTYKSSGHSKPGLRCYAGRHSDGSKCVNVGQGNHAFGTIEKAAILPSTHVFNFVDMTVTQNAFFDVTSKTSKKTTYLISDYTKKVTPYSIIHILKIGSLGMKEIRIDPDAGTIAYHYEGGKVLVFKDLKRVASFELLDANSKLGFLN